MAHYIFKICTAWCIVCDVFYLPEYTKGKEETALELANKCQNLIAKRICLDNLSAWDGGLKRKLLAGKAKESGLKNVQEKISKKFSIKLTSTEEKKEVPVDHGVESDQSNKQETESFNENKFLEVSTPISI